MIFTVLYLYFQEDGTSGATGKEDTTDVAQLFKIAKQLGRYDVQGNFLLL